MIKLCKKYGIQVINKKHRRFIKKNTSHLIQKKKESKWTNVSNITKEEIKFLREFNFYIKKYDERLYNIIYSDEVASDETKAKLNKNIEEVKDFMAKTLNDIVHWNNVFLEYLFCGTLDLSM